MPWGTPDQVLEKFVYIREMIGTNAIIPGFSYGGMPYDVPEKSIRLFAEEVLPELKSLQVEPLNIPGAMSRS